MLKPEKKEFFMNCEGTDLHMKLDMPEEMCERYPLVLLVHGFTGDMEEAHLLGVRNAAVSSGYAVLRIELYGHGKSGGNFSDHDIPKWLSEVLYVIRYTRTLPWVSRLILCGHSQGGLLTALAGGVVPELLDALIPLSPALSIPEEVRNGLFLGRSFDPENIPDTVIIDEEKYLNRHYFEAAREIYPDGAVASYHGPVLIVHGNGDTTIDVSVARRAASLYERCSYVEIEGDTHCFDFHLDEMEKAVGCFLAKLQTDSLCCGTDQPEERKKVAFICVHNSCRSQMAEALGNHLYGDKLACYSAGTELKARINQDAVRIIKELYGIDMEAEGHHSKLIDEIPDPDIAISMGCDVGCPFIGRPFDDDWGLPDPTGKEDEEFKKVIAVIVSRLKELAG